MAVKDALYSTLWNSLCIRLNLWNDDQQKNKVTHLVRVAVSMANLAEEMF